MKDSSAHSREQKKKQAEEEETEVSEGYENSDIEEESSRPPRKPLLWFLDLECSLNEEKESEVHRVGWSYQDGDTFFEADTVEQFVEDANSKTVVDGQEQQVVVVAHNMRGFDGMFIQDAWYDQGCSLDKILSQGAKMLSFECGNLVFRDSLNFFNMPLEKLPATFNLLELNKVAGITDVSGVFHRRVILLGTVTLIEQYMKSTRWPWEKPRC